jgi:hypothetical protein
MPCRALMQGRHSTRAAWQQLNQQQASTAASEPCWGGHGSQEASRKRNVTCGHTTCRPHPLASLHCFLTP